jgi:hypothetical protein
VSQAFQRNRLFGWNCIFNRDINGVPDGVVYYYLPDGVTMLKIQLDAASLAQLNAIIGQIEAWMKQSDTWSGEILETWKLQTIIHPATQAQEWVKQ